MVRKAFRRRKSGSSAASLKKQVAWTAQSFRSTGDIQDNWFNVKHRMVSTVALMWRDGLIKDEDIYSQLGGILNGTKPGRENDEEIIYFNAIGTGLLDLAVTTRCYRKALETGVGTKLVYWED